MLETRKRGQILQYILIYLIILDAGSGLISVIGLMPYYAIVCMISVFTLVIYLPRQYVMDCLSPQIINDFFGLALLSMLSFLVTVGGFGVNLVIYTITKAVLVGAAICVNKDWFSTRFVRLMTVLAVVSLLIFAGYYFLGTNYWSFITSRLYCLERKDASLGNQYGLVFLCFNYFDPMRNSYICGEPGEYQLVLSTALFLLLTTNIKLRKTQKSICLIILMATLVTTQSTTGYFNLVAIVALAIFGTNKKIIDRRLKWLMIFLIITYGGIVYFSGSNDMTDRAIISKVITAEGTIDVKQATGLSRWNGFVRLGEYIRKHFIHVFVGIGAKQRDAEGLTSCNGLTNTILDMGMIPVLWMIWCYARTLYCSYRNVLVMICGLFIILNTWVGQPVWLYASYIVIAYEMALSQNSLEGERNANVT